MLDEFAAFMNAITSSNWSAFDKKGIKKAIRKIFKVFMVSRI
jgi:hypothetical protein